MLSECNLSEVIFNVKLRNSQEAYDRAYAGESLLYPSGEAPQTGQSTSQYSGIVFFPKITLSELLPGYIDGFNPFYQQDDGSFVSYSQTYNIASALFHSATRFKLPENYLRFDEVGSFDWANMSYRSNVTVTWELTPPLTLTYSVSKLFREVQGGVMLETIYAFQGFVAPSLIMMIKTIQTDYRDFLALRYLNFPGTMPEKPAPSTPDQTNPDAPEPGFGYGTAWATSQGFLVTACHVVENTKAILIIGPDGRQHSVKRSWLDPENDVAVLEIEDKSIGKTGLPLATAPAKLGEEVFTIGFPHPDFMGFSPKYTSGVISSKHGLGDDPMSYQISVPIQGGNSGGPLINKRGEVVGIVVSKLRAFDIFLQTGDVSENVNYAVKIEALTNKTPWAGSPLDEAKQTPASDLVERCSQAVYLVVVQDAE
jgi:S1-C subfamily serine protease